VRAAVQQDAGPTITQRANAVNLGADQVVVQIIVTGIASMDEDAAGRVARYDIATIALVAADIDVGDIIDLDAKGAVAQGHSAAGTGPNKVALDEVSLLGPIRLKVDAVSGEAI